MGKKNIFAALLLATAITLPAAAQENGRDYEPYPYTFIGVQGGAQETFSNPSFSKLITPVGAVSVGRFFSPVVGARLNVQGWMNKSGYKTNGNNFTYDFKYATTDIDLLINLSNLFAPKKTHFLNAILVGGLGLSYAWDCNDQASAYTAAYPSSNGRERLSWAGSDHFSHNLRIGMQLEANVSKHLGINLEVTANHHCDNFNAKLNGKSDWQAVALVGLTYKFGFKKKPQTNTTSIVANDNYDNDRNSGAGVATAPVVEDKKPVKATPVVKAKEKKQTEVFFKIGSSSVAGSEANKVADLAQWLKDHPSAKVKLTGYADAGTGTAAINKAVSEKRVNSVKKELVDKYGIDASRISTDYKGDTVQPFSNNDSNRVTVAVAEE